MTQFYSRNDVNYNGDVYSIPFPYMKEEEIQVYLDDVLFTDWFFLNDSQIRLRNLPEGVTSETVVSVRRVTNIDNKVVTYTNNTLLNKENLNLSQDQLLFAVQEIYDNNIQNNIDIRAEVDEKVERVSDAVEQLEALNDAVETAVNASIVAEEKVNVVLQKESELSQTIEQATEAINKASQDSVDSINQQATIEKAEIDELSEDLKDSIKDLKVLTTLEIGDIGIAPLGIDETKGKRRYLNGQIIIQDQYTVFTDKLKKAIELYPSLACTESEWQTTATMTVGGQVGKFVVGDEAGTIRLPKIIMPIQGLTDLSKLAEIIEAGLPNITGNMKIFGDQGVGPTTQTSPQGALYSGESIGTGITMRATNHEGYRLAFDASRSNAIYGKSNTVQPEAIKYPYFIQVATGAETEDNIINEIELNNPFSLLDYKYSEYELNNLSWLRSNGQWNSKAVYPAVYELLLKIYNGTETKAGVSVKLSTDTFTDYDFVLNTADETFRLPLRTKDDFVVESYANGTEWYRVYKSGWVEQGGIVNVPKTGGTIITLYKSMKDNKYSTLLTGETYSGGSMTNDCFWVNGQTTTTIDIDMSSANNSNYCSWYVYGQSADIPTTKTYFYVGETVQNANLINAGRIEEKLVDKVDTNASNFTADGKSLISSWGMPSSKYIDLTLGASGTLYTAPANGWVYFNKIATATNQNLAMGANGLGFSIFSSSAGQWLGLTMPIQKGRNFYVSYTANGATNTFRFHYAQGEV